jgi:O-methyltransferase
MLKYVRTLKDFLVFSRVFLLVKPLSVFFKTVSNFSLLTSWISKTNRDKSLLINDFYVSGRNFDKRYKLYDAIGKSLKLETAKINYVEFGVASGNSFKWWLNFNKNTESCFSGFDTFEGLPESWGGYKKGDMSFTIPAITDKRSQFYKGLFQETLNKFLDEKGNLFSSSVTIVHLDADLFSSTIFVLTQLYRFLKKGDIILFDEFSVPNHEFLAYKIFTEAFGVKLKPVGAVNNFFQIGFIIDQI